MRVSFTKMYGLGNDFVVLDARDRPLPDLTEETVKALSDRHTGIGCDQLIVMQPSTTGDFAMRIYNCDGGEVESCGNAARAVALLHGSKASVDTRGGLITVEPDDAGARVDMGKPNFDWNAIPLQMPLDTLDMPVAWDELEHPVALSIGNPHIVFFVEDCHGVDLARIGPQIERDPLFPERINVNVATVKSRTAIDLRVWERGAGLTRACGTGACATTAAAIAHGFVDRRVTVELPGGSLQIEQADDGHIWMSGPATRSFEGSFEWDDFA